jgi:uncharacterized protein (DUF433 family)
MSNQYTIVPYTNEEINNILRDYQNGISYSRIALKFKRNRIKIKNILIENGIWVEGRDELKKEFSNEIIEDIIKKYKNGLSCQKISKIYNVSREPIERIIKEKKLLRAGYSNGIKIELTEEQKETIKKLYVMDLKTSGYISEVLNLNKHFIDTYIQKSGYRRTLGKSISLRQTGKKRSEKARLSIKVGQQKLAQSGKRKQTGGICKRYIINGLVSHGTYEKFYIEKLINEKKKLPLNSKSISTPFGVYYPDFSTDKSLIEIKSDYTYDILIGKKVNRWSKKIDTTQLEKIRWVNKNIKPVDILVVDKRNNKIIKKWQADHMEM